MKIGMLWYDNSKDSLSVKIERATAYYLEKYGKQTRSVFVNPSDFSDEPIDGVRLVSSKQVLRNHLWLTESDDQT